MATIGVSVTQAGAARVTVDYGHGAKELFVHGDGELELEAVGPRITHRDCVSGGDNICEDYDGHEIVVEDGDVYIDGEEHTELMAHLGPQQQIESAKALIMSGRI
jgi:hypothetical protein